MPASTPTNVIGRKARSALWVTRPISTATSTCSEPQLLKKIEDDVCAIEQGGRTRSDADKVEEGCTMSPKQRLFREIDGKMRTVRELLAGRKYSIDYYQREYKWQTKQVSELLNARAGL